MVVTQAKAPVTASRFLDYIHGPTRPVLVFDGATGTSLQDQGLTAEDFGGLDLEGCNENLVITRPDAVQAVHRQFLDVGCDVIETDTFGAASIVPATNRGFSGVLYSSATSRASWAARRLSSKA